MRIGPGSAPLGQFERERIAIGSVSGHPNIVTVHDSGLTPDRDGFIVMEYLADGTLSNRLQEGPLPWPESVVVGVSLSGALESAHRAGVLHLDVKPENVFVSQDYETVKLGDFGIARVVARPATRTDMISGTVLHIPPELLRGQAPTEASDVYSLGSTLFTLIAGHPPFGRPHEPDPVVMTRMLEGRPVIADLGTRGVPPPLCEAIGQALAQDPADRQESAVDFGEQLRRVQAEAGLAVTPMKLRTPSRDPAPPSGGGTLPPRPTPVDSRDDVPVVPPESTQRGRRRIAVAAITAVVLATVLVIVFVMDAGSPPTPIVSPTSTPPPTDRPGDVFTDDFSNQSAGWPRGDTYDYDADGGYRIRIETDHNRVAQGPKASEPVLQALSAPGVDVEIKVDAKVLSGTQGGMGLYCRQQPGGTDRYRAVIYPNGRWVITRDSKGPQPLSTGVETFVHDAGVYRLRLTCSGPGPIVSVTLAVGGRFVGQWTDPDGLAGGEMGVQAATAAAPFAEVRFDNFEAARL